MRDSRGINMGRAVLVDKDSQEVGCYCRRWMLESWFLLLRFAAGDVVLW